MSKHEGAKRLFLGVRISLGAVQDLTELVESMQPVARAEKLQVRWLAPATYHLTLKFLGWAREEVVPAISTVVPTAIETMQPFDVHMKGVGAFPAEKNARVVWAGVNRGQKELSELAERLDTATTELGFAPEKRAFHPHVTIARLKSAADVSSLTLAFSEDSFRKSRIDRVVLFESVTHGKGAEYKSLDEWALG